MLGQIILSPAARRTTFTRQQQLGLTLLTATLPAGAWGSAWRLKRAAGHLRKSGVRQVVTGPEFAHWPMLAARGLSPVQTESFLQAMAPSLALAALNAQGIPPRAATICLAGRRADYAMTRAAEALCPRVRRLAICAPAGGRALGEMLRREYGLPLLERWDDAALTVWFSPPPGEVEEGSLVLAAPRPDLAGLALRPRDGAPGETQPPLPLLAAAWERGTVSPEEMAVFPEQEA